MKKIFYIVFVFFLLFCCNNTLALEVSNEQIYIDTTTVSEVEIREKINKNIDRISFILSCNLYNANIKFESDYRYSVKGSTYTIFFDNDKKEEEKVIIGKLIVNSKSDYKRTGNITLWNINKYDINNKATSINSINIKTIVDSEKAQYENLKTSPYLIDIQSRIVDINLKKNIYEYEIIIDDDIEELDLTPIPEFENATFEMTTQVIKEMDKNQIVIVVTDAKGNVQDYTIKIKLSKDIKVDDSSKKVDLDYKEELKMLGAGFVGIFLFTLVTIIYKNRYSLKRKNIIRKKG